MREALILSQTHTSKRSVENDGCKNNTYISPVKDDCWSRTRCLYGNQRFVTVFTKAYSSSEYDMKTTHYKVPHNIISHILLTFSLSLLKHIQTMFLE
jgi:hypothetical protein